MNETLARAPIGVIEATSDGEVTAINERAATLIETSAAAAMAARYSRPSFESTGAQHSCRSGKSMP